MANVISVRQCDRDSTLVELFQFPMLHISQITQLNSKRKYYVNIHLLKKVVLALEHFNAIRYSTEKKHQFSISVKIYFTTITCNRKDYEILTEINLY